ncbi:MAG: ATP-binding protein [Woeseiaceae bacterium]|nr:ATP-binding protein [Woeseiaceae bacterium]
MNLRQQLLLVSLLTLMLPWAGCEFIRETETALRSSQQQMLAGTARAIADTMAQYPEDFPPGVGVDHVLGDQLFGHRLESEPSIDGYFDDWTLSRESLTQMRGTDGPIRFAIGITSQYAFFYVEVADNEVVYADSQSLLPTSRQRFADRVTLVSSSPPYLDEAFTTAAEAPGAVVVFRRSASGAAGEPTIRGFWQDVPNGYQVEMRIPLNLLGTHLGVVVDNVSVPNSPGVRSASFAARSPGPFATTIPELEQRAAALVQPGMRLLVTDPSGWRIATAGRLESAAEPGTRVSRWLRLAYDAAVEPGTEPLFAEPDPSGREQQLYVSEGLSGRPSSAWFRGEASGRAIVAVAEPVRIDGNQLGVIVLQQGTDAILSLRSEGLVRLMNVTLIAMLVVAGGLIGYASWLSRRIRRLSIAAEDALESDRLPTALPSALAADEIGDLSRSFADVLIQLGEYNEYLRTLASKLSHELRTPLAIVTSSLENLEHETLDETAAGYTARARDGADRLRRILAAMSEASRVEELMRNVEPEVFDLGAVVESTVTAYRDVYPQRGFQLTGTREPLSVRGSPELIIQMLDKLVDNAVSFSDDGDEIDIGVGRDADSIALSVQNPGPPLPERMRGQLFDSMISVRPAKDDKHLGLGLYIARLIADGHGGRIDADNADGGVRFTIQLPAVESDSTNAEA